MEYEIFSGLEVVAGVTGRWVYMKGGLSYNFVHFPDSTMVTLCDAKVDSGIVEYTVFNQLTDICRQADLSVDCCLLNNDWNK